MVLQTEIAPIVTKMDKISRSLDQVREGTLCTLRNDILRCYYDSVAKGYRADYDFQNIHELFDAYEDLNGNSFVKDVIERFDALPTKEEYERLNKGAK